MSNEDLATLKLWVKDASGSDLDDLLEMGRAVNGMTYFDLGKICSYLQKDHARARGSVAVVALALVTMGSTQRRLNSIHLTILYTIYLGLHGDHPEFLEFDELLKRNVPDLSAWTADLLASPQWQNLTEPSDH